MLALVKDGVVHFIPLQAVHFKLIRTVQIILIYPVHLKVIWAVHLNRCNQVNKDAAEKALDDLEIKWGEDYPIVIKSWRDNWDRLTAYFQYSQHIRRIIYTTNTVEGYHRQLRKVTKNKGVFTSDTALEKLVYLAFTRIRKKWIQPVQNWGQTAQQLAILFPDRFRILACVSSNFASADFRKIKTYNFRKSESY